MTPEVLAKLGERGFTQGKDGTESGSGLGVAHAMATLATWGGTLRYESEVGKGTLAIIALLKAEPPKWFAGDIRISDTPTTVIVLDDDPGIHAIWSQRFSKVAPQANLIHFHSSEEILGWFRKCYGDVEQPLYLCDYELIGSSMSGLEVIEAMGIASDAILVTSRSDEIEIRNRCERQGLRLLPKGLSALAPIEVA